MSLSEIFLLTAHCSLLTVYVVLDKSFISRFAGRGGRLGGL
jgi:hypothetical protein